MEVEWTGDREQVSRRMEERSQGSTPPFQTSEPPNPVMAPRQRRETGLVIPPAVVPCGGPPASLPHTPSPTPH